MNESFIFLSWAGVALLGLLVTHGYATYCQVVLKEKDEDLRFMGSVASVLWPLSMTIMLVTVSCMLVFYWGPKALITAVFVRPRERRAAAEAAAKVAADEARYEVERGAHR